MPTTPAITGSSSAATASSNAFSALTSEDFIKVMFSELSRQDPLNPSDTNALLQQMSSLRSIQSGIDLSQKLESVVTQGQLATSGALLGKTVGGLNEQHERVEGVVKSVSKTDAGPVLVLASGDRVPFTTLDELLADKPAAAPAK